MRREHIEGNKEKIKDKWKEELKDVNKENQK